MKRITMMAAFVSALTLAGNAKAPKIDYSVVAVPEERGLELTCITQNNDFVAMPLVERKNKILTWCTNRLIDISPDGKNLGYLSVRDDKTNVFIKEIGQMKGAVQRTNRSKVFDFGYSPDGKQIVFSENRGRGYQIFTTDANQGFVCQQITANSNDQSPSFSPDMSQIFFSRQEGPEYSVWSYRMDGGVLSSYVNGMNPSPVVLADGSNAVLFTRPSNEGRGEIWLYNVDRGTEQCIGSSLETSYSTPSLSPDGEWIVCVGSTNVPIDKKKTYSNTDIYLMKADGSQVRQLTFHVCDDLSPVWSPDGDYIYFLSERGNDNRTPNVWRIRTHLY